MQSGFATMAALLIGQHSPLHVIAAGLIVLVGGYAGFRALALARGAARPDRAIWIAVAVLSFGVGAWSTHFVAMMGFRPDAALAFRIDLAVVSMVVAMAGVGAALVWGATRRRRGNAVAASLAAAATLAMHAVGMAGLANCVVTFDPAANLLAFCGAAGAYWLALRAQVGPGPWRGLAAAALFAAGLCWVHFVSLAGSDVAVVGGASPADLLRAQLEPLILLGASMLIAGTMLTLHLLARGDRGRQMIAAVATTMEDGAALLEADGAIIWANPALRDMALPGGGDALTLKRLLDVLSARDAPGGCAEFSAALRRDLLDAIRAGAPWRNDLTVRDGCARSRTVAVTVSAVTGHDGARLGTLLLLRDVTDDREREARLAAARDEAEALNRAKSQLLAVASHEMRTPLNGIMGLSELLGRRDGDARSRTMFDAMKQSVRRLDEVLSDVLEYAEGPSRIAAAPCAPADLCEALAARYAPLAAAKGLGFSAAVDDHLGDAIQCDQRALLRALGRLIDNAIKFSSQGAVSVTLRRGGWNERPAVVCEVADTGPGIDDALLQEVFSGFAQLDGSTSRAHGGLGLGLALTQRTVSAMRGVLTVASDQRGSRFSIVLPGATETGRDAGFYSRDIA